jgi:hypothetical protein
MTDETTFIAAFHRPDGSVTRTTQKLDNGQVPPRLEEHVREQDQIIIFFWRLSGHSDGEYHYDLASTPPVEVDPPGLLGITTYFFAHPQFDSPHGYTGFEADQIREVFEDDPRSTASATTTPS